MIQSEEPSPTTGPQTKRKKSMKNDLLRHASLSLLALTLCIGANAAHHESNIAETAA